MYLRLSMFEATKTKSLIKHKYIFLKFKSVSTLLCLIWSLKVPLLGPEAMLHPETFPVSTFASLSSHYHL